MILQVASRLWSAQRRQFWCWFKKQSLKKKKRETDSEDFPERKLNSVFFVRGTACKCWMLGKAAEGNEENPKNMVCGEITWQGFAQLPGSKCLSRKNYQHRGILPEEWNGVWTLDCLVSVKTELYKITSSFCKTFTLFLCNESIDGMLIFQMSSVKISI